VATIWHVEDRTNKVHACREADTERAAARKKPVATEADEPSLPSELAWVPYSTKPTLGLLARA
jgi:hypothetical protein